MVSEGNSPRAINRSNMDRDTLSFAAAASIVSTSSFMRLASGAASGQPAAGGCALGFPKFA
jgi:hypothetical protein